VDLQQQVFVVFLKMQAPVQASKPVTILTQHTNFVGNLGMVDVAVTAIISRPV